MPHCRILAAILLLWPLSISAQKKSTLVFAVKASNPVIRIDTTLYLDNHGAIQIEDGTHVIHAWAPQKKLLIDTFEVVSGKVNILRWRLKDSDYYTENEGRYKRMLYLPPIFTIFYTAGAIAAYNLNRETYNENETETALAYENYHHSISLSEIEKTKKDFQDAKDKLESSRTINNAIVISSAIIIPFGIFECIINNKKAKRLFKDEKPLLSVNTDYSKNFVATINIQF